MRIIASFLILISLTFGFSASTAAAPSKRAVAKKKHVSNRAIKKAKKRNSVASKKSSYRQRAMHEQQRKALARRQVERARQMKKTEKEREELAKKAERDRLNKTWSSAREKDEAVSSASYGNKSAPDSFGNGLIRRASTTSVKDSGLKFDSKSLYTGSEVTESEKPDAQDMKEDKGRSVSSVSVDNEDWLKDDPSESEMPSSQIYNSPESKGLNLEDEEPTDFDDVQFDE